MRRVAWFHLVIDTEDEEAVGRWLTVMAFALNKVAYAMGDSHPTIKLVEPVESGQSIPVEEQRGV